MGETITVACPQCGVEQELFMAQLADQQTCRTCQHRFTPNKVIEKPPPKPTRKEQFAEGAKWVREAAEACGAPPPGPKRLADRSSRGELIAAGFWLACGGFLFPLAVIVVWFLFMVTMGTCFLLNDPPPPPTLVFPSPT